MTFYWCHGDELCSSVPLKRGHFSQNPHKTLYISPVRMRYGVSFVNLKSDWYATFVNAVVCEISWYIGPRHNGTWLYFEEGICPCWGLWDTLHTLAVRIRTSTAQSHGLCLIGFVHGLPWCVRCMARGSPVTTKPDGEVGGFCGDGGPRAMYLGVNMIAAIQP